MRPSSLFSLSIPRVEVLLLWRREFPFWMKELRGTDSISSSLWRDGMNRLVSGQEIGGCNILATQCPSPPRWPARVGASEQRFEDSLLCCCWVTPTGNAEVMEERRRRQSRCLEKFSALSRDVGEIVLSKRPWKGLASPQLEAVRSYLRPWPLPSPDLFC